MQINEVQKKNRIKEAFRRLLRWEFAERIDKTNSCGKNLFSHKFKWMRKMECLGGVLSM